MASVNTPNYIVELWNSSGAYVMDISEIISTTLRLDFYLNDAEQVDFTIDLVQFERKCARLGVSPRSILDPYRTEVRVRRNDVYIVGTQVVQVIANYNNDSNNSIEVRCTGYLNFFKDRFMTANYTNKTYAQIARQLITDTQAQTNGNFGVTLGTDFASPAQNNARVRDYDNQNIKDGIINLTKLENDNFDFEFSHDKVFTTYTRKGSNKPGVELVYPQNINTMSVKRDATTLANKIIGLGSGVGEERLEYVGVDSASASTYRIRERTELFNSILNVGVLEANVRGKLQIFKDMDEVPTLSMQPNTLDINNIKVGDAVTIRIDDSPFIDNVAGLYRIINMAVNIDRNYEENVSINVVKWA